MQVKKIMTKNPACCMPDSSLKEVAQLMEEYDCGCIPVVESFKKMNPVGTITDRDITIRTFAVNQNPLEMKASDIMTTDIVTVAPETSVEECCDVMENNEIRRVLVVDKNGKCCGIVAQADVAQIETNPHRTADLVREISDSTASTRHETTTGGKRKRSFSKKETLLNPGSILTVLAGVGLGTAYKYYFAPAGKSNKNVSAAPGSAITGKTDKQPVIDKTPSDLSTSSEAVRTRSTIGGAVESSNKSDESDTNAEIGKSVSQR